LILCDLPSKTDRFFGRAAELSVMEHQLDATCNGRKGTVLCGISGSGKTQLALEYILQAQGNYSAVV
jgi:phosphoheptose isomerase